MRIIYRDLARTFVPFGKYALPGVEGKVSHKKRLRGKGVGKSSLLSFSFLLIIMTYKKLYTISIV